MPSLRSPLCQLTARLLIAALVFASLPAELLAARQLPPHLLTSLPATPPAFARVDPLRGPIHADGLGSIRRLTDEAGTITDGYTYSAFGELLSHTGSDPQPYAFAGEPLDPNAGFQFHRATWMDARSGRFTGMDPFEGLILDPRTLHRFSYVGADPVNKVDPTGRIVSHFFYGNLVHDKISDDFEQTGAGRITNRGGSFFFGRLPFGIGRYRPDLIDTQYKQLFEIKTVREYPEGQVKLTLYLLILNWADPDQTRPWTRDSQAVYSPTQTLIPLDAWGTYALVSPPRLGVITYDVINLPATIATLATVAILASGAVGGQITAQASFATQFALSGAF